MERQGRWEPIGFLDDEETIAESGPQAPEALIARKTRTYNWGAQDINHVSVRYFANLGAGAVTTLPAAAFPAPVSLVLEFESSDGFGAVLHCPKKITHEGYYRRGFKKLAKENAKAILESAPEVKERNFWVVTDTYTTTDVWTNAWGAKGKSVKMGFNTVGLTRAFGGGEIGPTGGFFTHEASAETDWDHVQTNVSSRRNDRDIPNTL